MSPATTRAPRRSSRPARWLHTNLTSVLRSLSNSVAGLLLAKPVTPRYRPCRPDEPGTPIGELTERRAVAAVARRTGIGPAYADELAARKAEVNVAVEALVAHVVEGKAAFGEKSAASYWVAAGDYNSACMAAEEEGRELAERVAEEVAKEKAALLAKSALGRQILAALEARDDAAVDATLLVLPESARRRVLELGAASPAIGPEQLKSLRA